jgi:hypothetical protein
VPPRPASSVIPAVIGAARAALCVEDEIARYGQERRGSSEAISSVASQRASSHLHSSGGQEGRRQHREGQDLPHVPLIIVLEAR